MGGGRGGGIGRGGKGEGTTVALVWKWRDDTPACATTVMNAAAESGVWARSIE